MHIEIGPSYTQMFPRQSVLICSKKEKICPLENEMDNSSNHTIVAMSVNDDLLSIVA